MNAENGAWAFIEYLQLFRDNYSKKVAKKGGFLSQRE